MCSIMDRYSFIYGNKFADWDGSRTSPACRFVQLVHGRCNFKTLTPASLHGSTLLSRYHPRWEVSPAKLADSPTWRQWVYEEICRNILCGPCLNFVLSISAGLHIMYHGNIITQHLCKQFTYPCSSMLREVMSFAWVMSFACKCIKLEPKIYNNWKFVWCFPYMIHLVMTHDHKHLNRFENATKRFLDIHQCSHDRIHVQKRACGPVLAGSWMWWTTLLIRRNDVNHVLTGVD